PPPAGGPRALGDPPPPDPGVRLSARRPWDESTRPSAPPPPAGQVYPARGQAAGQHLVDVHDHLRQELAQVRDLLEQVKQGSVTPGRARAALNEMTMRQNNWTLGAYCAAYCTMVTQHHGLEDASIFPHLRRSEAGLAAVLDRLEEEHVVIHGVVESVDRALVELVRRPGDFTQLQEAVDLLTDTLLSHLSYEEHQIVEPLARHGFFPGQL
ncbi:hemerythrin domain-containing protein, partial [Micromonospora tulbaghiae]|uniref:hemerythrin domain-containing protein n=1 Tax=Micromonospora tulbaghiae TaxID=479978 RepID=UPI0033DDD8CE